MSHHIPFDIQTEIIKRLPVIPLLRFRSVSKQWKSLIENSQFINDHTLMNRNRSKHHLLVHLQLYYFGAQYTSIIDDDTFPNQKSSLTLPLPLNSLSRCELMLGSVNGLFCFYGFHSDFKKQMAVLWNPIIKKSVGIVIPHQSNEVEYVIGFGFCSDTSDPKLVKVNNRYYKESDVMVFTLSSRVWKSVSNVPPIGSFYLDWNQVCIKGCIYWWAEDRSSGEDGETNVIISFDLKSEKFGQVRLPQCLLQTDCWKVAEVNESLGVLAYDSDDQGYDDEVRVCGVWMMDFVTKSFTKMFTIKQHTSKWPYHGLFGVLGFRKNGEVIIAVQDGINKSRLEVYEPSSRRINGTGINGKSYEQSVSLYLETLLLLDETSSIIPL